MQQIPLSRLPGQTLSVVLGASAGTPGVPCTLSLSWRQERLYLDLSVGDTMICQGAICQNRTDVVRSTSPEFPGSLHFYDLEGDRPPHWQGLHTGADAPDAGRWILLYVPEGEELPPELRF